jgi:hypothetical protein
MIEVTKLSILKAGTFVHKLLGSTQGSVKIESDILQLSLINPGATHAPLRRAKVSREVSSLFKNI